MKQVREILGGKHILTLFGNSALMLTGLCPFTNSWFVAAILPFGGTLMVGLATAMFIGLFAFGHEMLRLERRAK